LSSGGGSYSPAHYDYNVLSPSGDKSIRIDLPIGNYPTDECDAGYIVNPAGGSLAGCHIVFSCYIKTSTDVLN